MTVLRARNAYALANLAECGEPDGARSPGALFLLYVQQAVQDHQRAVHLDLQDDADLGDTAHQIADDSVPIYTHELWATFVDISAYQEDLGDWPAESIQEDASNLARGGLYVIAERLASILLDEASNEDPEV